MGGNVARFERFMDNAGGLCKHGGMGDPIGRELGGYGMVIVGWM